MGERQRRSAIFIAAFALASAAALASCQVKSPSEKGPAAVKNGESVTKTDPPRWLIAMVVDGFGAWLANERLARLPRSGGFARLTREGAWYRDVRYEHAATDTAPDHAALFTGESPARSGIFANEIVDPSLRRTVSILRDANVVSHRSDGGAATGSSLSRLRADTFADRFRSAYPTAPIASLSWKDRGALFGAGRSPNLVVWHDAGSDSFVTVGRPFPSELNAASEVASLHDQQWTLADAKWVRENVTSPDAESAEGDLESIGITFPHSFAKAQGLGIRVSPYSDAALLRMATRAIDVVDPLKAAKFGLLSISLSTHDYVHHIFGPDSWESWDELYRLDAALAAFMTALDARFGVDGYTIILSADHGTGRMPEITGAGGISDPTLNHFQLRERENATRIEPKRMQESLERAFDTEFGPDDYILGIADPYITFTDSFRAALKPGGKLASRTREFNNVLSRELAPSRGIAHYYYVPDGVMPFVDSDDIDERHLLVRNSLYPGCGDVYVLPRPGSYFGAYVFDHGAGHGTPYLYDRSVPVFVRRGSHDSDAGKVINEVMPQRTFFHFGMTELHLPDPR